MAQRLRDRLVRAVFPRPRCRAPHSTPARILVIRPDHLGDLLFATPALAHLRAAYPAAHLTGLVGPWGRAVWERQPALDAVETLPFPGIVARPPRPWQPYALLRQAARRLAAGHYDMAIILRFDYWWGALLAEQAGIPVRWGYNLPGMLPFLSHPVPYSGGRHEVEQDVALVKAAAGGAPAPGPDRSRGYPPLLFPRSAEEDAWAQTQVPPARAARAVAIHPGTNGSLKLWTLDSWATVADWLVSQGYRVLVTGTVAERPLVEDILARVAPEARPAVASLAGATTLGQLAALFARSAAVLGVDSGPLHIATAVGARTLRLYGPSDEAVWGPWGPARRNVVIRAPGTRPGHFLDPDRQEVEGGPEMQAISPEQVLAALPALLESAT